MALKPCRECRYPMSTRAAACPRCGARQGRSCARVLLELVLAVIVGCLILYGVVRVLSLRGYYW